MGAKPQRAIKEHRLSQSEGSLLGQVSFHTWETKAQRGDRTFLKLLTLACRPPSWPSVPSLMSSLGGEKLELDEPLKALQWQGVFISGCGQTVCVCQWVGWTGYGLGKALVNLED